MNGYDRKISKHIRQISGRTRENIVKDSVERMRWYDKTEEEEICLSGRVFMHPVHF